MSQTKMQEGDIVRLKGARWTGRLDRLREADRCGGGRWLIVGKCQTAQPSAGLRAIEFVYRPQPPA